jgi:hypothetical protein
MDEDHPYSGYWVPLLIATRVSAAEILEYYETKSEEYFFTKVLGKPYVGGGNKLTWELFAQNITGKAYAPMEDKRVVIGIDTGLKIDYVMGDITGLFHHATTGDYDELDRHMERWPKAIAVIDAGGDLIGSRKFFEHWRGRVFLCHLAGDRKTKELLRWGVNNEYGNVIADRNRLIQMVVDEFIDKRTNVHGTTDDWHQYWLDWDNLTRIKVTNPVTNQSMGYKWVRSARDHKALATAFWRVGMSKYGFGGGEIISSERQLLAPVAPVIQPDMRMQPVTPEGNDPVTVTLEELRNRGESDWRT